MSAKYLTTKHKLYLLSTLSYGFFRKAFEMKDATIREYDWGKHEEKRVPVLISDKVLITGFCSLTTITLWPLYLLYDIRRIEVASRKLNHDSYLFPITKNNISDYIFF
jgi:hypothetical protein